MSGPGVSSAAPPREARLARLVYAAIAAHFFVPAVSYALLPELTTELLSQVNGLLGGSALTAREHQGHLWHMLAVGNVMTLAFMSALLAWDLRRFQGVLPGLLFLKGFSAFYGLALGFGGAPRFFFGVFVLDGVTLGVMWATARWGLGAWARAARGGASSAGAP